jgi:hypothetical protein
MTEHSLSHPDQSVDFPLDSRWEHTPSAMAFPNGDTYALHHMDMDEYYLLPGSVAAFIWDLCDGSTPVEAMIERIVEEYDIDHATARADLIAFLSDLQQQDLIIRS